MEKLKDKAIRKKLSFIVAIPSTNEEITVLGVDTGRTCLSTVVLVNKITKWHE